MQWFWLFMKCMFYILNHAHVFSAQISAHQDTGFCEMDEYLFAFSRGTHTC